MHHLNYVGKMLAEAGSTRPAVAAADEALGKALSIVKDMRERLRVEEEEPPDE